MVIKVKSIILIILLISVLLLNIYFFEELINNKLTHERVNNDGLVIMSILPLFPTIVFEIAYIVFYLYDNWNKEIKINLNKYK